MHWDGGEIIVTDALEMELSLLVEKEGLNNPEVYYKDYESFEEIPLFSRWDHISFLQSYSFNEKNKILIRKGLELVSFVEKKSIKHLKASELKDYFACLTITDWDDYEEKNCLSVNIFITRKKQWILSHLRLKQKSSIEENLVKEYLCSLNADEFDVYVPDCEINDYSYCAEQPFDFLA